MVGRSLSERRRDQGSERRFCERYLFPSRWGDSLACGLRLTLAFFSGSFQGRIWQCYIGRSTFSRIGDHLSRLHKGIAHMGGTGLFEQRDGLRFGIPNTYRRHGRPDLQRMLLMIIFVRRFSGDSGLWYGDRLGALHRKLLFPWI